MSSSNRSRLDATQPEIIRTEVIRPNGIQAVLFDLDGTLRHNRPASEAVFCDFAVRLGLEDSPAKRLEVMRWSHYYWAQSQELLADVGAFQEEDPFWRNYSYRKLMVFGCREEQADALASDIHQLMKTEHKPADWVPDDVPQTLQALKEAGFRLGVLSNRTLPCQEYLQTLGLADYFDLALVAGEVACWKPEPQIFQHALERLDVTAEQSLYVGDNYYADIVGARRAGLHPVLLDPLGVFPEAGCPVIHTIGELKIAY